MNNPSHLNWGSATPTPAVLRAGAILSTVSEAGGSPVTPAALATALRIPRSSAVNICSALVQIGLLRPHAKGFTLGPGLAELSQSYLDSLDPVGEFITRTQAMPAIDETLQLGTLEGTDVVYLAIHGGRTPLRITSRVGSRISATCTALGKAMLATFEDHQIEQLLKAREPFPAFTEHSITDTSSLLAAIRQTRLRGYATDDQETTMGITCLAVAVPGLPQGTQPYAVSTSLLTGQADERRIDALVTLIRELVGTIAGGEQP